MEAGKGLDHLSSKVPKASRKTHEVEFEGGVSDGVAYMLPGIVCVSLKGTGDLWMQGWSLGQWNQCGHTGPSCLGSTLYH